MIVHFYPSVLDALQLDSGLDLTYHESEVIALWWTEHTTYTYPTNEV